MLAGMASSWDIQQVPARGLLHRETQSGLVKEARTTTKGTFLSVFGQRKKEREKRREMQR
jgi:hypothetical protein